VSLRTRLFILRFDPLPELVLKSRLNLISPTTVSPGKFDIKLHRSDLRYFLLNGEASQQATLLLCTLLNTHPLKRANVWKRIYNTFSLQTFGCYILTLSLLTDTGFSNWKDWIEVCDPNISMWMSQETVIDAMEKMWLSIYP
jgi:hypothetical protein